jgi:hypothetical protein
MWWQMQATAAAACPCTVSVSTTACVTLLPAVVVVTCAGAPCAANRGSPEPQGQQGEDDTDHV